MKLIGETLVGSAWLAAWFTVTVGAVVSMVMLRAPEDGETFPTASVAVAVMLCVAAVSAVVVME